MNTNIEPQSTSNDDNDHSTYHDSTDYRDYAVFEDEYP